MELVEQVYRLIQMLPHYELYGLAYRMQQAVVSVPLNIAFGHAKMQDKEYIYALLQANASLIDLKAQLDLAVSLNYLSAEQVSNTLLLAMSLNEQLQMLCNVLRTSNHLSSEPKEELTISEMPFL
jgi:four helix bundle protein